MGTYIIYTVTNISFHNSWCLSCKVKKSNLNVLSLKGKWQVRYAFMDDWFQAISEKSLTHIKRNRIYRYESGISIYFQRIAQKQK